ncbi:MAG: excisionase family DNA-binding protein [Candidatus Omnitrophica bacterium]|nr:excisionase family DNA-binding protein [Candidatus Omnitrophota bacterium]
MTDTKHCLSVRQFAKNAGVTKEAIFKAIREGRIKAEKVDTALLIPKSELRKYLARK